MQRVWHWSYLKPVLQAGAVRAPRAGATDGWETAKSLVRKLFVEL